MRFAPEDRAEIADIVCQLALASRQEPGCVNYIPHQVEGDSDTMLIYEQYVDQQAEEAHRQSAHFKKFAVGGLFQKMLERSREDLMALV
jgi:quinol monooxygenase YgiN